MPSVYDGQTCVGTIEADNGLGILAFDANGEKIGCYPTSTEAVSHVLRAWRNPAVAEAERDAELIASVERFMMARP
jgi:hypothetical protein